MTAITYKNTKTALPGWVPTVHVEQTRGYAYETNSHFVHIYGKGTDLWVMSVGLTATQEKAGTLQDWVVRVFGAADIEPVTTPVGAAIQGVWRPALYFESEVSQALQYSDYDLRSAEQALRLLVERLDELLLYVEPDQAALQTYSHKARELLILACTEIENGWKHHMRLAAYPPVGGRDYSTRDYVRLLKPLHLSEWELTLRPYGAVPVLRPFQRWDTKAPSQSLPWYEAYNKTKHDRSQHFSDATLGNCITAVAANIVLFCVRFGPFHFYERTGALAPIVNHLFQVRLIDCCPTDFYVPLVDLPVNARKDLICGKQPQWHKWTTLPLTL
jgi:hypothetical protein